jgi:hypothetical protein
MSRDIPTQLVTVEPNSDVLDRAERLYSLTDTDVGREKFLKRVVVDSVRLEVNLASETKAKTD